MKGLTKVVTVLAKVLEVFAWVGSALVAASLIAIAAGKADLLPLFSNIRTETELTLGGFSIDVSTLSRAQINRAYVVFFVTLLIVFLLMAMVFRNIYLIFKTAEGKTKFSRGATPFQPDIVRMIREIGIFCLAVPVLEIIMSIIARLVIGFEGGEIAVTIDVTAVFFGLVVLCLSQFFAYGAMLQKETEGLV